MTQDLSLDCHASKDGGGVRSGNKLLIVFIVKKPFENISTYKVYNNTPKSIKWQQIKCLMMQIDKLCRIIHHFHLNHIAGRALSKWLVDDTMMAQISVVTNRQ